MVSALTVKPNQVAVRCSPTSIWAARIDSFIAGAPPFSTFRSGQYPALLGLKRRVRIPIAQLLPHWQRSRCHQEDLEEREAKNDAQAFGPENESDDQRQDGNDRDSRSRVEGHRALERMITRGDRVHRTPNQQGVEQTQ